MKNILIAIIPCIVLISSCSTLLGVKEPKAFSDQEVDKFSSKFVGEGSIYRVDFAKFSATYDSLKNSNPRLFRDLYQPMQIMVFNKERENIAHIVNCYINSFPLKWNRTKSFDNFPLKANGLMEPAYKVSFQEIRQYATPFISEQMVDSIFSNNDYLYVVYYSKSLLSVSKGMFRNLKNHLHKYQNEKIATLYVFMEDIYVGMEEKKHE